MGSEESSDVPTLGPTGLAVMVLMSLAALSTPTAQQAEQGPKTVATAPRAMASSSHPDVTRVMLDVLRQDGNAVDAIITAIILQPILEPQMSTLAGGTGALIYEAKTKTLY